MIRTSLIIPRIRERCPIFGGRVVGSLGWAENIEAPDLPVPYAFVLPLSDQSEGLIELSQLEQELPARFAVVVVVRNSDEPGKAASDLLMDARDQLHEALIGFVPEEGMAGIIYAGMADAPEFNRARAVAQFEFYSTTYAARAAS